MMPNIRDRVLGCFIGGAVGDALGAPVEFMSWAEIESKYGSAGIQDYQEAYGRKGAITDDTQMSLFTAEAMIRAENRWEAKGVCGPVEIIRNSYLRWLLTQDEKPPVSQDQLEYINSGWLITNSFLHHRRAPGVTVVGALTKNTDLKAENNSKGCGGVMRVAPIGLVANEPFELAADAAHITHGHATGYLSAGAFSQIISFLISGKPLVEAIDNTISKLKQFPAHEETLVAIERAVSLAGNSELTVENVESLGQGWIAEEALAIALYCALQANSFPTGVLAAVNHSGDCDSTGAICGNILGLIHGVDSIPKEFLEGLEGRDVIEQLAFDFFERFFTNYAVNSSSYDRYPGN